MKRFRLKLSWGNERDFRLLRSACACESQHETFRGPDITHKFHHHSHHSPL
eukprot:c44857_g1_i1 orf=3-152(-)